MVAVASLLSSTPSFASTGGPLLVKVLGWDRASQRVYCQQMGFDEGLDRECIYYFSLAGQRPERAVVVPWSIGPHFDRDTLFARRFAELRSRLRPLEVEFARAVPFQSTVVSDSVVTTDYFRGRRYVVDVVREVTMPAELRVTTFHSKDDARLLREYRVPGFRERLAIVSFIGDMNEGGYEVQQAVLLGPRVPKPQVLDNRRGVLP